MIPQVNADRNMYMYLKGLLGPHRTHPLTKHSTVFIYFPSPGHDGLILEFRASKPWMLSVPFVDNLKAVTSTLWDVMDIGGRFMENVAVQRDVLDFGE